MSNFLQPFRLQPTRPLCPWGISRQEYWSGLPCPPQHLPLLGTKTVVFIITKKQKGLLRKLVKKGTWDRRMTKIFITTITFCSSVSLSSRNWYLSIFLIRIYAKWSIETLLLLNRTSRVWLCKTLCTAAHQAPLSMGFSRQEYWSRLPLPSPIEMLYTRKHFHYCPTNQFHYGGFEKVISFYDKNYTTI